MNGRFLLDTNIVIAIFANDASVKDSLLNSIHAHSNVGL